MDGALLVDKPVGLSSNAALQRAKKLLGARKAGHAGTLDPLASGLLVVLFGEATKFAAPFLDSDKEYVATLKLGERTATGDAEGEVVERKPVAIDADLLGQALARFVGPIEQVPPMYSALKRDGVPLYKLARRGTEVERKARRITIGTLECLEWEGTMLKVGVRCSKGTYVRTLAEDIGLALGTVAHLSALRRTGSGRFRIEEAVTLEALEAMAPAGRPARVLGLAQMLSDLPSATLDKEAASRFSTGQPVRHPSVPEGLCAVYAEGGAVLGLGTADGAGLLRPQRLLAASQAADKHQKSL